ncbi:hypothetical protein B0H11DRAFT_2001528 [Mycena galericulata]|nr:hypothetical protein B0H11DRAFT_2001528 [Mycena galericulata]
MDPSGRVETEMSRHQRNLVDVCLEEGQYESAIGILGQLRSPYHKPSAAHIRQLLFIALYDAREEKAHFDPTSSPSKKPKKSHLLPSVAATLSAQQLLASFAATNSPAAVIRTLRTSDPEPSDDNECFVATESLCITRCRNCWEILAENFSNRHQPLFSTPKGKGKQRDTDSTDFSPVGETAWPVLDWLLLVFERDELENPILRIPPCFWSSLGRQSRRETDAPLNIISQSLQENDRRRRLMGSRLMNLLINLSATTQLDFPMLVVSLFNRLSTSSLEDISSLMSTLSPTPAVSKFKIALYQKYSSDINDTPKIGVRPRPQARAQPKGSPVKLPDPAQPVSLVNKFRAPSSAEILRIMEAKTFSSSNTAVSPLRMKFELLVSYNAFQTDAPAADRDPEWPNLLHNGAMARTLDVTFGCRGVAAGDGIAYRDLLDTILNVY